MDLKPIENLKVCEKTARLLNDFFEDVGGVNMASDELNLLMEVYVQFAPVDRTDLANTVSYLNRLKKLLFNLGALSNQYHESAMDGKVSPVKVNASVN